MSDFLFQTSLTEGVRGTLLSASYCGRITFRGILQPLQWTYVHAHMCATRPGTYALSGWRFLHWGIRKDGEAVGAQVSPFLDSYVLHRVVHPTRTIIGFFLKKKKGWRL